MKKHVKIISLVLAFAMALSMCACTAKPSGSGIVKNDAQSKPESPYGADPEPVPTTTEPTDPVVTSTPTPTPAAGLNPGDPIEMSVPDLMYISNLCIGLTPSQATELLTSVLGIKDYAIYDGDPLPSGETVERFLRKLDRDIVVEGITFKSIGMYCNDEGLVFDLNYSVRETAILDANEAFDSESAYKKLYPVFCANYDEPSDDYEASWIDFDKSGNNGWRYGDGLWVSIFWGMSCNSVKGNDQLVIGIEYDDPSSLTRVDTTESKDVSFRDAFQLMQSLMVGLDIKMAENMITNTFGVNPGTPKEESEGDTKTYTYNVETFIEGYRFNQIEINVRSDNTVYYIGFINTTDSGEVLRDNCADLRGMAIDYLEMDPTLEYPLTDDNDLFEFYDFSFATGHVLTISAYYTDFYSNLWFCYQDSSLG